MLAVRQDRTPAGHVRMALRHQPGLGLAAHGHLVRDPEEVRVERLVRQRVRLRRATDKHRIKRRQRRGHGQCDVACHAATEQVDAVPPHLLRQLHRPLRIAMVVARDDLQWPPAHAALGIDLVGRDLRAVQDRSAQHVLRTAERGDAANTDRVLVRSRGRCPDPAGASQSHEASRPGEQCAAPQRRAHGRLRHNAAAMLGNAAQ